MFGRFIEKNQKKSFFFCESFVNMFFVVFIGIFSVIFMVFLMLSMIFLKPIYPQTTLFSLIGVIFFISSRAMFMRKYRPQLKNLNYASFLISRNRLFFWILWTFNFYLMFCWIFMIFLGATHGLGIDSSVSGNSSALVTDSDVMKITGLTLCMVHVFLLIILKIVVYYWSRILAFTHREFEKRRRNLSMVRSKAAGLKI